MNKKLIAAIAATTMAGAIGFASVAAADMEFNWYGSLRAGLVSGDDDSANSGTKLDLGATGKDGSIGGQGLYSRIGIKASNDLGNGSSAGLKLERGVGDTLSVRHTNVWIKGGWGKLTLGQQGNPYRNARNWDQTWFLGGQYGFNDGGSRIEGLRYDLATGPFSLSIMATANDNGDKLSDAVDAETTTIHYYTTAPVPATGATVLAADMQGDTPLFISGTTAGGMFTPGNTQTACTVIGISCAIGYELGDLVGEDTDGATNESPLAPSSLTRTRTDVAAVAAGAKSTVKRDDGIDSWILAVGYDFGAVNLNVAHRIDNTDITAVDAKELDTAGRSSDNTAIGLNGSAGPFGWYLTYQTSSDNREFKNDVDSWGGFVSLSVSDNDKLYFYHVSHDADRKTWNDDKVTLGTDVTETILGYSHSFGGGVSFIGEYLQIDKDLPTGKPGSDPNVLALALKVDF